MINHEKEKLLGAFNLLQMHMIMLNEAKKKEQSAAHQTTASYILPREIMNLIGVQVLALEALEQLSALVAFMQQPALNFNTETLININKSLSDAMSINSKELNTIQHIYNTTFTRIIELIGNRKEELLREAAKAGNELAVMQLLKIVGIDVNAIGYGGTTALMWSAYSGRASVVTQLLNVKDIGVNATDTHGGTALMWAAYIGHTSVVTALLNVDGILVNAKDNDGGTALMWAAYYYGHASVVTQLLNAKDMEVNAVNFKGRTALMMAAYKGHTSIVTELLNVPGIDVNVIDNYGYTALMVARSHGRSAIVSILLEAHKALFFNKAISTNDDLETLLKEQEALGATLTRDMMCDYLLKQVDAAPTNAEKTTLLNNALGSNHTFGTLMRRTNYLGLGRSSTAVNRIESARECYTEPTYGIGRAIWTVTYTRSTVQHSNPIRPHHSIGF